MQSQIDKIGSKINEMDINESKSDKKDRFLNLFQSTLPSIDEYSLGQLDELLNNKFIKKKRKGGSQKRLYSSKTFYLTYSRCPVSRDDMAKFFDSKGAVAYIIAQEMHHDENNKDENKNKNEDEDKVKTHLHCYVKFKKAIQIYKGSNFDYIYVKSGSEIKYHPNIQTVRNTKNVVTYITKEDKNYIQKGIDAKIIVDGKKSNYILALESVRDKKMTLEEAATENVSIILNYQKLKNNFRLYDNDRMKLQNNSFYERQCFWIYGTPRIGKTYSIFKLFSPDEIYNKSSVTKWWDNYNGEKAVLIDDWELTTANAKSYVDGASLIHDLKIYGDNYLFIAQVKNGSCIPTYRYLFVTSNYSIEDCFGSDQELCKAIKGRFNVVDLTNWVKKDNVFWSFPKDKLKLFN